MTQWTEEMIREALDAMVLGAKPKAKPAEPERDFIRLAPLIDTTFKTDRMRNLAETVGRITSIDLQNMMALNRQRHHVRARHIVYYIARHAFNYSFPVIGDLLGRDHSTIMHGVTKVENNPEYFEPELSVAWNLFKPKERAA